MQESRIQERCISPRTARVLRVKGSRVGVAADTSASEGYARSAAGCCAGATPSMGPVVVARWPTAWPALVAEAGVRVV